MFAPLVRQAKTRRAAETGAERARSPRPTNHQAMLRLWLEAQRRRSAPPIQPKLAVGPADGPLEREADRVADQVMRMPAPGSARPPQAACGCEACGIAQRQAKATGSAAPPAAAGEVPRSVDAVLGAAGRPLDAAARAFFEPRFGADFGAVRIHDDVKAARSAEAIGARAYASGRHIAFAPNAYAPGTAAGRRLLAHELTHVVQQSGGLADEPLGISRASQGDAARTIFRQPGVVGPCFPSGLPPGGLGALGTMAHMIIEDDYLVNVNPGAGAVEYSIPESGPGGRTGRADLVDLAQFKIYEIKTPGTARKGVTEAVNYRDCANEFCPPPIPQQWSIGNDYPAHLIPTSSDEDLQVRQDPEFPGVVVYERVRRDKDDRPPEVPLAREETEAEKKRREEREAGPTRQPAPVSQPESEPEPEQEPVTEPAPEPQQEPKREPDRIAAMEVIKIFISLIVFHGEDPMEAARRFRAEYPTMMPVALVLAAVIVAGAAAADDLIPGGVADDPIAFAFAGALIELARAGP